MADNAVTRMDNLRQSEVRADAPMVAMIERIAMDPSIPLDRLEQMLAMKERMDADAARKSFAAAFARAAADFPPIPLNGKGHNGKPYATLKDITSLTRPHLSAHGFALTFSVETGEHVTVTAELMHKDGHSKSTSITLPRDNSGSKNAVQSVGSTQTYGQRYTAQAILGLSLGDDTEDDGGAPRQKSDTVSLEQFIRLRDLIEETGTDLVKFFTAYGHSSPETAILEDFPAALFPKAVAQLERKRGAAK